MGEQDRTSSPARALGLISLGHFMSHFWSITLPPLFILLASTFHVSFVELGLLMTAYSLATAIFQVPCGYFVDRHGGKWLLVAGILANAVGFGLCAVAGSYAALLGLMLLAGAGQAVFHPADYAIMSALYPKEKAGKPYALHTFTGFAGSAAAPLLVAGVASLWGWKWALAATGVAGLVVASIIGAALHAPRPRVVGSGSSKKAKGSTAGRKSAASMYGPAMVLLFSFFVFGSMFTSGIRSFLPATLTQRSGLAIGTANGMLTAFMAALALGVLAGGVWADRTRNHKRLIGWSLVFGTALMVLIAQFRLPGWLLFAALAACGALRGIITPSRDKLVREAAPEGSEGKSFAFVSVGLNVGGMVAPVVLGALLDGGAPARALWMLAAFSLVTLGVVGLLGTVARNREQPEQARSYGRS